MKSWHCCVKETTVNVWDTATKCGIGLVQISETLKSKRELLNSSSEKWKSRKKMEVSKRERLVIDEVTFLVLQSNLGCAEQELIQSQFQGL